MRTMSLLLLWLFSAAAVGAQSPPALRAGANVRIAAGDSLITGRIAEIRGDTLVINRWPANGPISVAFGELTALEVRGRGPGAELFANTLAGIGAATGAALYLNWCLRDRDACRDLEQDDNPYDDEEPLPVFGTMTIGLAVAGLAIGYALTPARWRAVQLPVRIGVTPSPGGLAAYVSVPAPRFLRAVR